MTLITAIAAVAVLASGLSAEVDRQEFQGQEVQRLTVTAEAAHRAQHEQEAAEAAEAAAQAEMEERARRQARAAALATRSVWDVLAQCESGGDWSINTGNGYYGGLQFNLQTWRAYGGTGYPHEHPREVQIAVAERLRAARGFQPWPACSRKLGLR